MKKSKTKKQKVAGMHMLNLKEMNGAAKRRASRK